MLIQVRSKVSRVFKAFKELRVLKEYRVSKGRRELRVQ
jgi:hypothetical protein